MPADQLTECGAAVEPTADDADDLAWLGGSAGSPAGAEAPPACPTPIDE